MTTPVFLALGSNLGDRARNIERAVRRLRAETHLHVSAVSPIYETDPIGGPEGQSAYFNAVVRADTTLSPEVLLERLLDIEKEFGRERTVPNAPRILDLDILLFGDHVRAASDPMVPHPRMHERRFVLAPLADLAPDFVHPVLKLPIRQLLEALPTGRGDRVTKLPPHTPARSHELAGLRAMVTGSTSGIGKAIALELARAGASVIIHGRRSPERASATAKEIQESGGRASVLMADLRDPAQDFLLVSDGWELWNGLDIWINNAGADLLTTEATRWSFERKWEELLAVDVSATIRLSRAIGEKMRANRGGVILTIGWDQAETGMEGDSGQLFSASKAAIMAFTKSLAKTLAPKVRVNCLAPGWIRTSWGETASVAWQDRVRRETPQRRWGLPEDVAAIAKMLVSPSAEFITGQIVRINGGVI